MIIELKALQPKSQDYSRINKLITKMIKWLSKYQEDVEDEVKANLCVLPTLSNTKYITVHMLQVTVTPKQTQA